MTKLGPFSLLLAAFASLAFLPAFSQSVTVSPTSVAFGNQAQGTSSTIHNVTLKNGQSSAISISSIATNVSDYTVASNCPVSPATLGSAKSCTISITFTPSVQGTRNATLTITDTGLSSPQLVTLTGTGTAPILESIAVTPSTASVVTGSTQQFTATGTYSDGSTQNLTTTASWSSSSTSVATVGLHTGLAKGVTAGAATITATSSKISGAATLTVTAATLTSISVTPATASVAAGRTEQFTATGTYSNGTTQNLTSTAAWTSSAASVATVSAGLATAVAQGTATISASSGSISGSATLTVTAAVLTSIAVTPSTASIATGATQQFTATGTYSNGSTQNLTTTVSWISSATSVATVGLHTGLAKGVSTGTATITASLGTVHGTAALTVGTVLTSISVTPNPVSVAAGNTQQFTATGTYSNGTMQVLTSGVTWTSSATSIATVNGSGLATTITQGTATITAASGTISGSAAMTVTPATLTSLSVTPATPSFALGTTEAMVATGTYSDGSTLVLSNSVSWTTANASVATINPQGIAASVAVGSTTVTATSGAISGSTTLTVTPATLVSIAVTPAVATLPLGATQQFTATGTFSDGTAQNITNTVLWSSDTPAVATISNTAPAQGIASGVGQGTADITASSGSITASITLTVSSAVLESIAIAPATPSIAVGTAQQFTATGIYSDGSTQNLTSIVSWSSNASSIATINSSGLAQSAAVGTANISAEDGTVSATTAVTVTSATLVSLAISPQTATVASGTVQQFTATGTFSDGTTQNVTQSGHWSSTAAAAATISDTAETAGLASALGVGSTTIVTSFGSINGSATLVVTSASLASIAIAPTNSSITLGATQQFTATGTFTDGSMQDLTSTVNWSSSPAAVAIISNVAGSNGLATSSGLGNATVTAASGSINASTGITVGGGVTLVSIAVTPSSAAISAGGTQPFTATGTYSDGSTQNLTNSATWSSSDPAVATISNNAGTQGIASGESVGTTTIIATSGSVSGSASLSVSAATLVSIAVSPESPTISLGANQQFTATGTYSDGSTQNITNSVAWSSGTLTVATISNSSGTQGLAVGVGVGVSTISAMLGVSASTSLTVTQSVASAWTLHGPVGRSSHSTVWDPNSKQMIVFGGQSTTGSDLNDVWLGQTSTTQNESFTAETPSGTVPEGRYGHVATYDPNSNRMMIFAGASGSPLTCLNDAWILSGANGQSGTPEWSSIASSGTAPAPRAYSGGVYDPNTNSMIVFGGSNCSGGYFNDVWVLSNANGESGNSTWTQLNPAGTRPAARESASAVYDSTNNILTIFGGDAGSAPYGDVWVLSHANGTGGTPAWTQLSPTGMAPHPRTGHTATYDSVNDRMTIFGGLVGNITLDDTWVLTFANGLGGVPAWVQITSQGTAPSLSYHSAVYDQVTDNMYVFGGSSSQSKLQTNDHAFTLTGANGISSGGEKWVLGGPPVRYSQSAFYDPSTNALFIFGGQHSYSNLDFGDYWAESNAIGSANLQWTALSQRGSVPTARFGHTGLYDSVSNRMMVFGGATGFPAPCVNDYHVMEQANIQDISHTWLSVTPSGTLPGVRALQASAYDGNTNTLMIFGGYNCASTYYNDVWILSDANDETGQPAWTQLQPTGNPPSARESSTAIYDPSTNSLVIYGGDAGGEPLGDIWILSNANGSGGTPAWTQLIPSNGGPVPRSGHTATYDSVNNVMTIYGGYDGTNVLGDVWTLSAANGQAGAATWSQLTSGQTRRFHSSEYDAASNQLITYGGAAGAGLNQDPSSDVYTLTDANNLP